jgi:hypothetical protein
MKALVTTLLLNLGCLTSSSKRDVLMQGAQRKTKVDAAFPSCKPTV